MSTLLRTITLNSEQDSTDFAKRVGELLSVGDVVLLEGDVGAGKTFFARKLIQSLQQAPEDVPSPTFTLVQSYETSKGEVVHADLYRLAGPDEIIELGLLEAFDTAICLIEWPDRLSSDVPRSALTLTFITGAGETDRLVSMHGDSDIWGGRLEGIADGDAS